MESFKCNATVLFCDIRNFVSLFENRDPIDAVRFANEVLAVLGNEIEKNGGVVDRFTGDGLLSHFGVEKIQGNHADAACKAAISLRKVLVSINSKRYFEEEIMVNIGMGIHTGEVAFGEIITGNSSQSTILGNTVNIASRIEQLTKYFSVDALISESTSDLLETPFHLKKMPKKKIKGLKEVVETFWLLPTNS